MIADALVRQRTALGVLALGALLPPDRLETAPVLCPVRRLTGRRCPGCGLTRSVARALHGDLRGAARHHPLGLPLTGLLSTWAVTGGAALDPDAWTSTPARRRGIAVLVAVYGIWALRRSASGSQKGL